MENILQIDFLLSSQYAIEISILVEWFKGLDERMPACQRLNFLNN